MKIDQNKEISTDKLKQGSLLRCPMCKGRGFFEPTQVSTLKTCESFFCDNDKDSAIKLPQLASKKKSKQWPKPRSKYNLPSINNIKNLPENRHVECSGSGENEFHSELLPLKEFSDGQNNFDDATAKKTDSVIRTGTSQRLSLASSTDSICDPNLLPSPKTPKNPVETFKLCMSKLKSNNWNESVNALKEIVQISRFQPEVIEPSMVLVYRRLISLLKSFRSIVARTACQASNELFATMANSQRPEFDEVVNILLQKTADTNKAVRQDANEALDTMILNIPHSHSIRAIINKGITHKSPLVRGASARLLVCVVGIVGVETIFNGGKETRGRILNAGATFMQDGNQEVRNFGKRLIKMFIKLDDFDEVLQSEVSEILLKRIEKTLITMKYKT